MKKILLSIFSVLLSINISVQGRTLYVNGAAAGGEGASWEDAFTSLQDAIDGAEAGDEIWIAKGTYYPEIMLENANTARDKTFILPAGVKIYGGFAGGETSVNDRPEDVHAEGNRTILSGNEAGTDVNKLHHVVMGFDIPYYGEDEAGGRNTILDGITISGGYANLANYVTVNGQSIYRNHGAGMYLHNASPVLNNVIIEGNYSIQYGAGLYVAGESNPLITNSVFQNNTGTTALYGSAIYLANASLEVSGSVFINNTGAGYGTITLHNTSADKIVTVTNTKFYDNSASNGGAIYLHTGINTLNLHRVQISGNTGLSYGGAIYLAGGTNKLNLLSTLISENKTTVASNSTGGGGIYVNGAANRLNIINTTIADNKVGRGVGYGYGIYLSGAVSVNIHNSIIWSNFTDGTANSTADIQGTLGAHITREHSLVKGFNDWTNGNLPGYISPLFNADYTLQPYSPTINTGSNTLYESAGIDISKDFDLSGTDRRLFGDSIDMGAYELNSPSIIERLYVDNDITESGDGSTWQKAIKELSDAINIAEGNSGVKEIWVKKGIYYPLYNPVMTNATTSSSDNRDRTFVLPEGVKIYGGFAGNEGLGFNLDDRDFEANETTLSGNIGTTAATGAYRVVVSIANTNETYLDGFTISEGTNVGIGSNDVNYKINNINVFKRSSGTAMLLSNAWTTLNNIIFEKNGTINNDNAALYIENGTTARLSNVIFREHTAANSIRISAAADIENNIFIDGMLFYNNTHNNIPFVIASTTTGINNVDITNSEFYGNRATTGLIYTTGVTNDNNVTIRETKIYNNTITTGTVYLNAKTNLKLREVSIYNNTLGTGSSNSGGALYINGTSNVSLLNTLIYGNTTYRGGGIYVAAATNTIDIVNTTIVDNTASNNGSGIYLNAASPVNINNSIIWNPSTVTEITGTVTRQNSLVRNFYEWTNGNIPAYLEPLFEDGEGVYTLQSGSPCIDGGANRLYTAAGGDIDNDKDLAGNDRILNAVTFGDAVVDIGAYEFIGKKTHLTSEILYVKEDADGSEEGLTWGTATSLDRAIEIAEINREITQIWIAKGTYYPGTVPQTATATTDRDRTFLLPGGVKIYGGFAGGETNLVQRTDIHGSNSTILSGNLTDKNPSATGFAYHVVTAINISYNDDEALGRNTVLDGITISEGYANGNAVAVSINGANIDRRYGAGMYLQNAFPVLNNVIIKDNSAAMGGGALYLIGTTVDNLNIRSTKIYNNTATTNGGAMFINTGTATVNFLNTLIYDNAATNGGAIYTTGANNTLNIVNTTIADSKASASNINGYGVNLGAAVAVNIHNSIIWSGNSTAATDIVGTTTAVKRQNSLVKGFDDWTNNNIPGYISPLFENGDGIYTLQDDSPCIDAGDNRLYTAAGGDIVNDKDLAGSKRLHDATGADGIDMGAYEYAGTVTLSPAPILYVKKGGSGNGSTWADALPEFAEAIKLAERNREVTQIWVGAGIYYPDYIPVAGSTNERDNTFMLPSGVKIYGGFPDNPVDGIDKVDYSNPNNIIDSRALEIHETILSGDLGTLGDDTDNAYHVVMAFHIPYYETETEEKRNTVLDGITILGGNANENSNVAINGVSVNRRDGAGIYMYNSSIELKNIIIKDNNSTQFGAGLYTAGLAANINNLTVTDTEFTGNTGVTGGAMYVTTAGTNNIDIRSTEFYNNTATSGGAVYVNAGTNTLGLNKVQMYNNTVTTYGGAIYTTGTTTVNLVNTLIYNNEVTGTAGYGGAIYAAAGTLNIVNTTIADNKTANVANGYGMWLNAAVPVNIHNSIIWSEDTNSTSEIMGTPANLANIKRQNSLVKGYYDWSNNNIAGHISPVFKGSGNYELESESPCIDAGDNGLYTGIGTDTDLSGINPRLFNATATDEAVIDMGAYEYATEVTPKPSITKLYVKKGGSGNETGEDWDNAIGELADAISKAEIDRAVEEIWVAKGTYSPSFDPVNASPGRDRTFILPEGVKIYGGFAPNLQNEDGAINERNLKENETILSGEDGVYHVVMAFNVSYYGEEEVGGKNTVLDGFTITGGNANTNNNVTINGQTINRGDGAGIYLYNSSLELKNITIKENSAMNGGAIYIATPIGNPVPTPTVNLLNSLIYHNKATTGYGGAIYANGATNTLNIVNTTIADNETTANAAYGYGIYLATTVTVNIHNSIIWSESSNSTADIQGNLTNVTNNRYNSLIKGYNDKVHTNGGNNIPGYLSPLFNEDYTLKPCSPAIDRGDNSLYTGAIGTDKDLSGTISRLVGGTIDIGAYEFNDDNTSPYSSVLYVDSRGSESGDGLSWATAIKELADAINIAEGSCEITEIWVAKGTYYPKYTPGFITTTSGTTARDQSFMLPEGVIIYGGFNGTEVTLAERPKDVHAEGMRTILSGDINSDGTGVHHVVMAFNIPYYETQAEGRNTVLDGITISGGNANLTGNATINGQSVSRGNGAGMYLYNASIELNDVISQDNLAINGGAVYVTGLSTVPAYLNIRSTKFYDNTVTTSGGAMYIAAGASTVNLLNTLIASNTAATQGGGIYATGTANRLNIVNTTIADNTTNVATNGPGIYTGVPTNIYNSIVWSESTVSEIAGTVTRKNSLVKGHNDKDGSNNIPGYISPLFNPDYTLQPCSPAIEGGDNDLYRNADIGDTDIDNDTDLTGENTRLWDAAAGVAGGTIDMGAYEFASLIDLTGLTIYVDSAANDGGDGLTWATAFSSLDDAINMTERSCVVDSILVAKGTYIPRYDPTNATAPGRDRTFMLPPGVKIYGGYAGIEEANPYERNTKTYSTILSGNYNTTPATGAYHVVMAFDIPYYGEDETGGKNTVLDGITISGGYANVSGTPNINGVSPDRRHGAGIYLHNASPVLNDVIIEGNYSILYGAGLYVAGNSYPRITNSVFQNNTGTTALYGSAIYLANASLEISGSVFTNNTGAGYGTIALSNTSVDKVVTITDTKFQANSATNGGAIYVHTGINTLNLHKVQMSGNTGITNGGAMYINAGTNTVNLLSTLIHGNIAASTANNTGGGAIYVTGAADTLNIVNTTIADNKSARGNAGGYGIYIYNTATRLNIHNSVITSDFTDGTVNSTQDIHSNSTNYLGNNITRKNSLVKGFNDGINNSLPGYISPLFNADYTLQPCSPGVDTGDSGLYMEIAKMIDPEASIDDETDLLGSPRLYGGTVDMGAYELNYGEKESIRLYVNSSASDGGDGLAWATAFNSLDDAINIAAGNCGVDEIWVAKGTYYPRYAIGTTATTTRDQTFVLPKGVAIYGGFIGTEQEDFDLNDRQLKVNETILSGDFNNNGFDANDAHHVVMAFDIPYYEIESEGVNTVLDGITISGGYANVNGSVTINGVLTDRRHGAGIYLHNASPVLNNVTIESNYATVRGSGLYAEAGSHPRIKNSVFKSNTGTTTTYGAAIYLADAALDVSGSEFTSNTGFAFGTIAIANTSADKDVTITDTEFTGNATLAGSTNNFGGGAIYLVSGENTIKLSEVQISGNRANGTAGTAGGGAVFILAGTNKIDFSQVHIFDNEANNGGVIHIVAGTNELLFTGTGNILSNNIARSSGGAIYVANGTHNTINLNETQISENKAVNGGGIYVANGTNTINLRKVQMYDNTVTASGGAMYIANSANTVNLLNTLIYGNTAATYGGAIYANGASNRSINIVNTTIADNKTAANTNGYGIYLGTAVPVNIHNSIIWSNFNDGVTVNSTADIQPVATATTAVTNLNSIIKGYSDVASPLLTSNYRLSACSPAIDGGDNDLYSAVEGTNIDDDTDLTGQNARLWDAAADLAGGTIDMGAFEFTGENNLPSSTLYVNINAEEQGDGYSWASPLRELSDAIDRVNDYNNGSSCQINEIWVAAGTYYPQTVPGNVSNNSYDKTFLIPVGVKIYGGFPRNPVDGTDMVDYSDLTNIIDTRDLEKDTTILSGDFTEDGRDANDARHVLLGINIPNDGNTVLDGFTVYGGNASGTNILAVNGVNVTGNLGGGMFLSNASLVLNNIVFENNYAGSQGGAVYIHNSEPVITNTSFNTNTSASVAGAVYIDGTVGNILNPKFNYVVFTANSSPTSGGMFIRYAELTVNKGEFISNKATTNGGGAISVGYGGVLIMSDIVFDSNETSNNATNAQGGAISMQAGSTGNISNSVFRNNKSAYYTSSTTSRYGGGAIYLVGEASDLTELSLINVLMHGNEARQFGGAIYSGSYTELNVINSTLTSNKSTHGTITAAGHAIYLNGTNTKLNVDNSIIWGNGSGDQDLVNFSGTLTRRYSLIASFKTEDSLNTGDNIGNILGSISPGFDTDYTLKICSPCIDTGNNEYVTSGMETDLDGNPRIWNADINQEDENGRVDMGAYEFNGFNAMPEIIYVNANTTNPGDGISWESPFQTFSEALDAVFCGGVKEIWVAEGTYYTTEEYGFLLPAGVKMYGGFPNPEDFDNPDMADRNWGYYPTVLSGNRQSYHIVVGVDIPYYETETETEINTTLDGFVIRESKAGGLNGSDLINGKDIYRHGGGGLYLHHASPILRNLIITDNQVSGSGGGIYLTDDSKLRMTNSVIHDNYGAGVYLEGAGNEFHIINTTIANNYSEGINNIEGRITVENSIVWGYNQPENSIVGNTGSDYLERRYSMVGNFMTDTAGNIPSINPAFLGSSFRLEPGSPLENKGSNALYPLYGEDFEDEKDIEGMPRLEGISIDIGAYEGAFCTDNVTAYADGVIYVHPDGGGSGASWGCAYNSLSAALDKARELKQEGGTVNQIWVARGTYYPETFPEEVDDSDPRNKSFVLVQGVSVYGGFADNLVGTEGNTNDRPYQAETILSGDIGYGSTGDDQYKDDYTLVETDGSYRNTEDNAYHIVLAINLSDDYYSTGLDGFVIEGGRADGISVNTVNNQTVENYNGAGIYAKNSIMSLDNLTVRYNTTDLGLGKGGGLYLAGNRTTLNSSSYNTAEIYQYNKASEGGAMYVNIGTENLYLGNKTYLFEGNTATVKGGAGSFIEANRVSSDGNYLISFKNNRAENEGGALYLHSSDITFEKSVFENNKAGLGGAIYNESNEMYISGSFTSNEADIHGGAVYAIYDGEVTFFNMVSGGSSKFQNNEAKQGNGGGVYAKGLVDMQYNYNASVTFTGNEALNGSGGAYYGVDNYAAHYHGENIYALFGSPVYIEKNRAKHAGGGFYLDTYQYILGEGFIVKNNTLSDAGSGVGAGIFNYNSYFRIGDLNVNDEERIWSQITGNTSTGDGGGLANYGGSKGTVRWVNISDNYALYGAGVSNSYSDLLVEDTDYYNSGLSFQNVKIESNYAAGDTDFERGGAAMFNGNASPRLVNTLIANNQINSIGGAGLFTTSAGDDVAAPVLVNVTVANNMVVSEDVQNPLSFTGAAMFNKGKNTQPSINNSIIWGNSETTENPVINKDNASPEYKFSLLQASGGSDAWAWDVSQDGGFNIDSDPLFINPESNFRITDASPAAEQGDVDLYYSITGQNIAGEYSYYVDLAMNRRASLVNEEYVISMGAYESVECPAFITPSLGIVYVTETGSGAMDGSSWADAYPGLADPLKYAADHFGCITEIWVARGTYYPEHKIAKASKPYFYLVWDSEQEMYYNPYSYPVEYYDLSDERDKAFMLVEGIKVYGGFAGMEASPEERYDIHGINQTILSGDIDYAVTGDLSLKDDYTIINADNSYANTSGNAYHVVVAAGKLTENTVLDGFKIEGGSALYRVEMYDENDDENPYYAPTVALDPSGMYSSEEIEKSNGGGIYIGELAHPALSNLIINSNFANEFGGGIYTLGNYSGGTPSTDYSIPLPMSADRNVAPMAVNTDALGNIGNDALKIQFVEISNNIALVGGGIFAKTENLFVKNFDIHHNTTFGYMTEYYGMAGDIGGGIYTDGTMLTLLNGKVTDNTAGYAGGIYMRADGQSPIPTRLAVRTVADDRNKDGIYYSLTNTTISGNHARNELQGEFFDRFYMGGLVVDDGMYAPCSHKAYAPIGDIYNTIIWGNTQGADYNIANLILGFNVKEGADNEFVIMSAFAHSLVEESNGSGADWDETIFGIDGGNNIDTIPYFVDYGGGNYRLLPNSPAIEVGSNKLYLDKGGLMEDVDIAGNPRFWNAIDNSSIDPVIDMGAYEYSEKIIDCPDPGLTEYADGIFVNSLRNGYGESWECSFHSLYDALTRANEIISSNRPAPAIYVAKGSYYPEDFILEDPIIYTNERNKSFVIINGVHVYGGYPDDLLGNETADVLRIYKEETFLSGDIDRAVNPDHLDSQGTLTGREGNAYHVVVATDNINAVTKLDGFVITGGNADGLADYLYSGKVVPNSYGGGLYASGSISLNNILFKGNEADKAFGQGGGAYVSRFANTFGDEVSFTFNKAYKGGGLYSLNIEFTEVDFTYNSATYGGGMYLELTPSALSVSYSSSDFIGNSSALYGGGVYIINESSADFEDLKFLANRAAAGGGIYRAIGTLNIQNLEFDENIATVYGGGGLYSEGTYSFQNKNELNITNTAFTNNRALSGNGGAIYNQFGHLNYGALTITANEAQGGSGGGIYNFESKIAPTGSDKTITLDENRAKYEGGGIANVDYTGINAASLYMTEGSISDNAVTNGLGGAVFNYGARLELEAQPENRIPVKNNSASGEGGGIANYAGSVINAIWTNIINNQTEGYGGGISNSYLKADEESLLKNMNITNNLAENRSEAEVERGGAGINNIASSPKLMNVLLAQNLLRVNAGAGMYNILESNPELVNVTLAGNTAEKTVGSGLYNNNSNPVIYNTVIAKNNGTGKDFYHENVETLDIQYSLVHGAGILPLGSDGDIDANFNLADITEPRFRNAATGNFRLDETDEEQRLIDAGNNSLYFGSETIDNSEKDLDNQLRVANDEVKLIDIGAYESPSPHNVKVSMRAFLEGPLTQRNNEPVMTNFLQTGTDLMGSQLPEENPYGIQGISCSDILDESGFASITDWILADVIRVVETEVEGKTKYNVDYLETKPLLLKSDGYIVDVDGEVPTFITQREPVFILLRHRNHLSVMTTEFTTGLLPHEEGGPDGGYIYDFTRAGAEPNAHKFKETDLSPMIQKYGVWCLIGGDVLEEDMITGNGEINSMDETIVRNSMAAGDNSAYLRADIDMNGEVNSNDHAIVRFGLSKGFYSTIKRYLGQ